MVWFTFIEKDTRAQYLWTIMLNTTFSLVKVGNNAQYELI